MSEADLTRLINELEEVRYGRAARKDTYSVTRLDDALTTLKALLPGMAKLLTAEQIRAMKDGEVLWKETLTGYGINPVDMQIKIGDRLVGESDFDMICHSMGTLRDRPVSRWWTEKPTPAQRRDTLWNW